MTAWRARYVDPDTGRMVKQRLDPLALPTAATRRDWAIRKSRTLANRRTALDEGAPRATGTPLADTIARYFESHAHLRASTLRSYRAASDRLVAWASTHGIDTADALTRAKLLEWREHILALPKHAPKRGVRRGKRVATGKRRAPRSINTDLRCVGTVLGYLVELDLFARLTLDDLRRALKRVKVAHERLDYLPPGDIRALLEAALRHDADRYVITREEHDGSRPVGTTLRYDPIAPFTAAVLLTGMRLGEALALEWKHVDLEALDHDGRKVGEIHLRGETNKTHHARTIGLEVSPTLHKLLSALKLRSGSKGPVFRLRALDDDGKPQALTEAHAVAAAKRLRGHIDAKLKQRKHDGYGAPETFTWQALRRTCGTFLTNAPGIFGAASAYRSAKQLGHSVVIAEKFYVDVARGISREARSLEAAMQIEEVLERVIAAIGAEPKGGKVASVAAIGANR